MWLFWDWLISCLHLILSNAHTTSRNAFNLFWLDGYKKNRFETLLAKSSSQGMLHIVNLPVPNAISPALNNGFHSNIAHNSLPTLREGQSWHWCSHQMQADKRGLEKPKRCETNDVFEDVSIGRLNFFIFVCRRLGFLSFKADLSCIYGQSRESETSMTGVQFFNICCYLEPYKTV